MPRDPTRFEHVRPGLKVKVVPEGGAVSDVVEGVVASVVSTGDDPAGVVVKLGDGTTGHVLRIWEGGDARRDAPPAAKRDTTLPTWNAEPAPRRPHRELELDERALAGELARTLGREPTGDLARLIADKEHGLGDSALRRFAIDEAELAKQAQAAFGKLADAELNRRLSRGPDPEADGDGRGRDDDDDEPPPPRRQDDERGHRRPGGRR